MNGGREPRATDSESGRPRRLFDVPAVAYYLGGISEDTVRELAIGVLASARVFVPGPDGRPLRKVLFDVEVVDRMIAGWRGTPSTEPGAGR